MTTRTAAALRTHRPGHAACPVAHHPAARRWTARSDLVGSARVTLGSLRAVAAS